MARKTNVLPSYLFHVQSGQARVRINGRDYLLGPYGSEESRIRYGELISKAASGLPVDPVGRNRGSLPRNDSVADPGPSVAELLLAFKLFADGYYVKQGKPTAEIHCLASAMKPVRELFALVPVQDFTPMMLVAVRAKYLASGWTRGFCNKSTNRIRHVFKWGVERGLVPVSVLMALQAVDPLKAGRCEAPEGRPRQAVNEADIEAVRTKLRPKNRDMLDLLLLIGCRPGELHALTWAMIDTSKPVWMAELIDHKTAHKGKVRKLFFGPRAQAILKGYEGIPADQRLFPTRRDVFSNVLKGACLRAGVTPFVPHELRHTAATRIRDQFGLEHAQAALGHAQPSMTAHYSSRLDGLAETTAAAVG